MFKRTAVPLVGPFERQARQPLNMALGFQWENSSVDLEAEIQEELSYFESDDQRKMFLEARTPIRIIEQSWQYSDERHNCLIIAQDAQTQIVWCDTGFGKSFPWSTQRIGETDLGMDCDWHAYLYEAYVTSTMWPQDPPAGFMHMAKGERDPK